MEKSSSLPHYTIQGTGNMCILKIILVVLFKYLYLAVAERLHVPYVLLCCWFKCFIMNVEMFFLEFFHFHTKICKNGQP